MKERRSVGTYISWIHLYGWYGVCYYYRIHNKPFFIDYLFRSVGRFQFARHLGCKST